MRKPNIVILVIDTLREDYSQGLEKLRELGFVKYENAIAPAPWTLPSHVSLITGLYPSQHEIHEGFKVNDEYLMSRSSSVMQMLRHGIIGELEEYGYETYIISANPNVSEYFGFRARYNLLVPGRFYSLSHLRLYHMWVRDYDRDMVRMFMDLIRHARFGDALLGFIYSLRKYFEVFMHRLKLLDLTMEKGSGLIKKVLDNMNLSEPFFMLINIMEAHSPYLPNDLNERTYSKVVVDWILGQGVDNNLINELRYRYSLHADYAVNRAIDIIRTLSRYLDNTLFIVTSDHGELLGDGGLGHGYFLKDGLLKVPLWVRWPNWFRVLKQSKPFVSLTIIPSIIRAVINNDEDYEVGMNMAVAESFGPAPYHGMDYESLDANKLMEFFSHRIRVYTNKCVFTYNEGLDVVEEGNCEESMARKIIDIVKPILST